MAIIKRGADTFLVKVYVTRDSITQKRVEFSETVHGNIFEARKREQILKSRVRSGKLGKPLDLTVAQLIEIYLDSTRHVCEITTQNRKKYNLEKYIKPYIGDLKIRKVKVSDVQNFFNYLLDSKGGQNGNG